jgi:predicted RNA-binding Zn ribbon-like protein
MEIVDLPLVGGHPALDLVNSRERGTPAAGQHPHDYLIDPAALLLWARRVALVDATVEREIALAWKRDPSSAHAALDAARDVRESLHSTLLAATGVVARDDATQGAALDRLHHRWAAAAARSTLTLQPHGAPAVRLTVGVAPTLAIPDRAADAALDLLLSADLGRLRRCPPDAGGCGWLFLDRSRNGSRKWCRMADCGTQVKARRLTERRRVARSSAQESTR